MKQGYKKTSVGLIPNEWTSTTVGHLVDADILEKPMDGNHGNIHPKSRDFVDWGIPFVMANNVQGGQVDILNCSFITKEHADSLQKGFSKTGDILLTHKATIGNTAVVGEIFSPYIMLTPQVTYYRVKDKDKLNNLYLRQYFDSPGFQSVLKSLAGGGTRSYIGISAQKKLPIVLPKNRQEQDDIATALSDIDALIEGFSKLITKKRDIKQATMQQLFSSKTRLPGFSDKWKETVLGEIAKIQRGASPRPIDNPIWFTENSSVGWVRISDVTSANMFLLETTQQLSPLGVKNSRPVASGGLIMSICATVGRPIITKIDVCIHDGFVVFDLLKADQLFIYYFLKWIEPNWSEQGQTGSQMNLNTALINNTKIKLPPPDEQTAIAQVLSDMDNEIDALEKRLEKTRMLKQGMMQELLTGRIRLV